MTLADLISRVQAAVQDSSYSPSEIQDLLNQALQYVAGRVLLPDLQTKTTVYAGTAYLSANTISFDSTTKTITDGGSGFVTGGFNVGDEITVTGSTSNDGTYTVSAASAGSLTVSEALQDEGAGATITIVNQGPNNVPLPTDYMRELYACYNQTISRKIAIYPNHRTMFSFFPQPDQGGDILHIAAQGRSRLYYQHIPSAPQTLDLYYYRVPETMSEDADEPEGVPPHLHKILADWVCKQIFSQIEDGIEGSKTNTQYYFQEFESGIAELKLYIGPEPKMPISMGMFNIDWDGFI